MTPQFRRTRHFFNLTIAFFLLFLPHNIFAQSQHEPVTENKAVELPPQPQEQTAPAAPAETTAPKVVSPDAVVTEEAPSAPPPEEQPKSEEVAKPKAVEPQLCEVTLKSHDLPKSDSNSFSNPREVELLYQGQHVLTLTNEQGGEGNDAEGLGLRCYSMDYHYVYVFLNTGSNWQGCSKYKLCDSNYLTYSADSGKTWKPLKSLAEVTEEANFALPGDSFNNYVHIFGDASGFVLSIFNLRERTTTLLSPELNVLKKVGPFERINESSAALSPQDFYYNQGTIYAVLKDVQKNKSTVILKGMHMEKSADYGKSWQQISMPPASQVFFLSWNSVLYQIFRTTCDNNDLNTIPAFNSNYKCGIIKIRHLDKDGNFSEAKDLVHSAAALVSVSVKDFPTIVWKDTRAMKPKGCGYVPLVGCDDSEPFTGSPELYEGILNLDDLTVRERKIAEEGPKNSNKSSSDSKADAPKEKEKKKNSIYWLPR